VLNDTAPRNPRDLTSNASILNKVAGKLGSSFALELLQQSL